LKFLLVNGQDVVQDSFPCVAVQRGVEFAAVVATDEDGNLALVPML
jgi:hypothetical protein